MGRLQLSEAAALGRGAGLSPAAGLQTGPRTHALEWEGLTVSPLLSITVLPHPSCPVQFFL